MDECSLIFCLHTNNFNNKLHLFNKFWSGKFSNTDLGDHNPIKSDFTIKRIDNNILFYLYWKWYGVIQCGGEWRERGMFNKERSCVRLVLAGRDRYKNIKIKNWSSRFEHARDRNIWNLQEVRFMAAWIPVS